MQRTRLVLQLQADYATRPVEPGFGNISLAAARAWPRFRQGIAPVASILLEPHAEHCTRLAMSGTELHAVGHRTMNAPLAV
jgi:hypothetical protein